MAHHNKSTSRKMISTSTPPPIYIVDSLVSRSPRDHFERAMYLSTGPRNGLFAGARFSVDIMHSTDLKQSAIYLVLTSRTLGERGRPGSTKHDITARQRSG